MYIHKPHIITDICLSVHFYGYWLCGCLPEGNQEIYDFYLLYTDKLIIIDTKPHRWTRAAGPPGPPQWPVRRRGSHGTAL